MPIRFYKLFDLLNRRGMKKSDLRKIISSATVAKLSKGEYVSSEVIEKICLHLHCQPSDIMEVYDYDEIDENSKLVIKESITDTKTDETIQEIFGQSIIDELENDDSSQEIKLQRISTNNIDIKRKS